MKKTFIVAVFLVAVTASAAPEEWPRPVASAIPEADGYVAIPGSALLSF